MDVTVLPLDPSAPFISAISTVRISQGNSRGAGSVKVPLHPFDLHPCWGICAIK